MFRAAPRLIARPASLRVSLPPPARRFLSTAPPAQKRRSWKSLVARLGVAGAVIYYYNTNDLFVEEPKHAAHALPTAESDLPTIESIAAEREKRRAVQAQLDKQREQEREAAAKKAKDAAPTDEASATSADRSEGEGGLEGLQEEAGQQGAFNPETGEINWDCPCLGGMATGPCGEEFKTAFSCFVFSKEEPKGMDCIDHFKNMQNCFRQYPEVYGSELDSDADDDNDDDEDLAADVSTSKAVATSSSSKPASTPSVKPTTTEQSRPKKEPQTTERAAQAKTSPEPSSKPHSPEKVEENRRELGLVPENYRPKEKKEVSESESLIPKASFDATDDEARGEEKRPEVSERK